MNLVLIVPGGFDPGGHERVIPALLWLVERLARRHEVQVFITDSSRGPRTYRLAGATIHELDQGLVRMPGTRMLHLWRQVMSTLTATSRTVEPQRTQRSPRRETYPLCSLCPLWLNNHTHHRRLATLDGPLTVIHGFWAGTSGLLAALAGKRLGVPVVVSIGGGELVWLPEPGYGGQGRLRSRVQAWLAIRLADVVTGGSRYALTPLAGRLPARCIPLGVDVAQFAAPVQRSEHPPWRLIHVASMNRIKDQGTLLQALRLIVPQEPLTYLDWVGEDTLSGAMQRLCAELGLTAQVTFHGFRPNDDVAALYRAAHVNLLSSRHESQAVVVGEAAAAGVPTVGTAVGIVAELAPDAAMAVPIGDAQALAAAVLDLLRHPARRAQIGAAAQAWARHYDADWTAAQFEQIYQELAPES